MKGKRLIFAVLVCGFTGCAQTTYRAGELPRRYAARSTTDYSRLDLTPFARQLSRQNAILPGDRLQVTLDPGTMEKEAKHVWNVTVDGSGQTTLPNIGPVKLAGLTNSEAEQTIVGSSLQRDVFLTPVVEVNVAERQERTILVTGAVGKPGLLKLTEEQVSLADVIVRSGGITSAASGVITVSGAEQSSPETADPVIANAILPVGQTSVKATTVSLETTPPAELGRIMVTDGTVVHIEEEGPKPIKVVGVIRNQVVEIPAGQNVRLLDAVTMAGGQTYSNWISDRVTITRHVNDGQGTVRIRGSIRKARSDSSENLLLAPYDIVTVEENALTFTLSTLSGLLGAGINATRIGVP